MAGWAQWWLAYDLTAFGVLLTLMVIKRITVTLRSDNEKEK